MTDFTLRPWREADAASIARYADNAKIAANLRDVFPCPYAPQDAATFVESCIRQEGRGQMCRAIEVDGEAAGSIGLFLGSDVYRRSAELGYWLGEPFWGRGIMTAAVETMCREGALQPGTSSASTLRHLPGMRPPAGCWRRRGSPWRALCGGACTKTGRCWIPAFTPW